jgi:hypothetical protein
MRGVAGFFPCDMILSGQLNAGRWIWQQQPSLPVRRLSEATFIPIVRPELFNFGAVLSHPPGQEKVKTWPFFVNLGPFYN